MDTDIETVTDPVPNRYILSKLSFAGMQVTCILAQAVHNSNFPQRCQYTICKKHSIACTQHSQIIQKHYLHVLFAHNIHKCSHS